MKLSTSKIEISGLNLERKLNMLTKKGIKLYAVDRVSKRKCLITVSSANTKQIIDLLSEKCYNNDGTISVVEPKVSPKGLAFLTSFSKRHIAFVLALILLVPLLWITSSICLKIDVNSTLPTQQVIDCLNEYGVSVGKSLGKIDINKLQNHLCVNLNVSYAKIDIRGSVLFVQLIDLVDFDDYVDLTSPYDIVAQHDGIVSKITVIQGNPLVAVGDTVKKGQVLIEGKRLFNDGTSVDVRAIGEVYAKVSVSSTATYSPKKTVFLQTENVFHRTIVIVGKVSSSSKEIPFENFEIEEKVTVLYPLNISIVHQTVTELQLVVVEATFQQALEELKSKALTQAMDLVDFVVTSTEYDILTDKSVTVTLHGEMKINSQKL